MRSFTTAAEDENGGTDSILNRARPTDRSVWENPSAEPIVAEDSDMASGLVWCDRTRRSFGVDVACDAHNHGRKR